MKRTCDFDASVQASCEFEDIAVLNLGFDAIEPAG